MYIYLITFFISTFLFYIAERSSGLLKYSTLLFSILLPSFLASIRSPSIGTDLRGYVIPLHNLANTAPTYTNFLNSWYPFNSLIQTPSGYERGFTLLLFICSKIDNNLGFTLFVIELLTLLPIFIVCWNFKDSFPTWLGILSYYLLSYNLALNLVRQSIAISILLLSFMCLTKMQYLKTIILVLIAILFHTTAVIGMIPLFIYFLIVKNNNKKFRLNDIYVKNNTLIVTIIVSVTFLFVSIPAVKDGIINLFNLQSYEGAYLANNSTFSLNQFLQQLPLLILFLIVYKKGLSDIDKYFFASLIGIDVIASQLATASTYSSRILWYFIIYDVLIIPTLSTAADRKRINIGITIVEILYLVMFWYINYVVFDFGQTIPFNSNIF